MERTDLTRVEFQLRADDAELLARLAALRGCSMAELIRRSLYDALEPLARAQKEREMKTAAQVADRRRLREWNEGAGLADRDPQMRKLREAMDDQ